MGSSVHIQMIIANFVISFSFGKTVSYLLLCHWTTNYFFNYISVFAFIKPYKSNYMNFSFCFHPAIMSVVTAIYHEVLASAYTLLLNLVTMGTLMYQCVHCTPVVRKIIKAVSRKCLSLFCQTPKYELTTDSLLPDRLENLYAY